MTWAEVTATLTATATTNASQVPALTRAASSGNRVAGARNAEEASATRMLTAVTS
jgi:hypothetical protein